MGGLSVKTTYEEEIEWLKKGKKYTDALKLVDRDASYQAEEAIELVKKTSIAKFDETVEVAVRLGVDPKKSRPANPWSSCASTRNW